MTNYDDSSYSLYWKGDIVCTDIKSYEQDKDWLVFISNTNQYVVDIQSQTISMTNIETVTNNAIEKQRKSWSMDIPWTMWDKDLCKLYLSV